MLPVTLRGCRVLVGVCLLLLAADALRAGEAKYVFLFIGDGMGLPQRRAADEFIGDKQLLMSTFPAQGITTTHASDRFITGSAAAATAFASGQKTNIGVVGMDPKLRPVKTLAEMAKERGWKVGIVSSVSNDHATPAAFYAHVKARGQYYDIDCALALSGFDYFAGGGLKDPQNSRGNATKDRGDVMDLLRQNDYTVADELNEFMALKPGVGKVLAYNAWLQDSKALPYAMDSRIGEDITLAEFTRKGIELLANDQGFFMMVEGGKIDWACHANDAAASIHDTLAFDAAIAEAYAFYREHQDETLIVVTGDHECGGLTLGFAGTKYATNFAVLGSQRISFQKFAGEVLPAFREREDRGFEALQPIITDNFGLKFDCEDADDPLALSRSEVEDIQMAFLRSMAGEVIGADNKRTYLLYGGYDPLAVTLTHVLNRKAGLAWTSYKHTGVPIATCAVGVGAEAFNGYYDNTDVGLKIMSIMGCGDEVQFVDVADEPEAALAAAE